MTPIVSIIIPVYNQEKYLNQCLDSIASQTFTDLEVMLVDDGSTDSSGEICRSFTAKDARFIYVSKPNGGVSSARNLGLEKARGEYVFFMDADDCLMDVDSLLTMVDVVGISCVSLTMFGYNTYNEAGVIEQAFPNAEPLLLGPEETITQMYEPEYGRYQGYVWNKLFRTDVIVNNHLRFDESIFYNEDRLFVTQYICSMKGNSVLCTIPVYKYYKRRNGAMASLKEGECYYKFETDFIAFTKMYKSVKKRFRRGGIVNMAGDAVHYAYSSFINSLIERGLYKRRIKLRVQIRLFFTIGFGRSLKTRLSHKK